MLDLYTTRHCSYTISTIEIIVVRGIMILLFITEEGFVKTETSVFLYFELMHSCLKYLIFEVIRLKNLK